MSELFTQKDKQPVLFQTEGDIAANALSGKYAFLSAYDRKTPA